MRRVMYVCALTCGLLGAVACSSKTESPLEPTPAAAVSPKTTAPGQDEQIGYFEQPVEVRFENLTTTATGTNAVAPTYTVEVARDSGFADKVFTRADIPAGTGSTSVTLSDPLQVGTYFWRVKGKTGTVDGTFSNAVKFEIESQGGHFAPNEDISEERMRDIIFGTGDEFPRLTDPFPSEGEAVGAAEELLRRIIWHLQQAGFEASRQRNPSGAISNDKLDVFIRGTWRAYDIMRLGFAGVATDLTEPQDICPDRLCIQVIPDGGIPD